MYNNVEKINENLKVGQLNIHFKPSDNLKKSGCSYIKLQFDLNENIKFKHNFPIEKESEVDWMIVDKVV